MKLVTDYVRRAEECEALAAAAISDHQRETILHIARTWRMLAGERQDIIEQVSAAAAE